MKFELIESKNIYSIIPLLELLNQNISEEVLRERLDEMIALHFQKKIL